MDQLGRWNRWYDGLPELWRFPFVVCVLVLIGAINMALTVASRFPFGLLVLLAILVLGAIRIPYLLGHDAAALDGSGTPDQPPAPVHADWLQHWNHWYESLPELWRFQVIVWALVFVGALNLALTIGGRFPFGLLVLLAIIAIGAVRVPYVMGWGYGRSPTKVATTDAAPDHSEAPAAVVAAPVERLETSPDRTVTPHPASAFPEPETPDRSGRDLGNVPPLGGDELRPAARPPAA